MVIKTKIFNKSLTLKRLTKNEKLGIFVANTWSKSFSPYVPMQTGNLDQNVAIEPFKVVYLSVYAHNMYTWVDYNFSKEQHPLAQAYWDRASYSADKKKVAREITDYLKKG